jgi:hypothetical protein
MMKRTASPVGLDQPIQAIPDTIGIVIHTDYIAGRTLARFGCGTPRTICYAVFPGQPLARARPHTGPDYLRPRREFVALEPGQSVRLSMEPSLGSYVFTNRDGRLIVRSWWPNALLGGKRMKLSLTQTGVCDISLLL